MILMIELCYFKHELMISFDFFDEYARTHVIPMFLNCDLIMWIFILLMKEEFYESMQEVIESHYL